MLAKSVAYLKNLILGLPISTRQAAGERLSKRVALAVFSSDALSSVAYATEEILLVLVLAGTAAIAWSVPISLAIVALLVILTISYRQTIFEYPTGGGAYTVAKSNLGELPGLTAAAALMTDYALTAAVSVTAGIAAMTSALPGLFSHREALAVAVMLLVVFINLRGVRESGRIFAVPTYLFIATTGMMIGVGLVNLWIGGIPLSSQQDINHTSDSFQDFTVFLLLRAFASGCTALTGVEAISNGISAFKRPESRNASVTLIMMAIILGSLFLGLTILAQVHHILPAKEETVISQIAHAVFGDGPLYFLLQISALLILILAANTSFADFPRLASLLAKEGYMPHQMANRGDRLVFSNGIILLGTFACVLIIVFRGDTHALIPLYAVGVFISFTLSQVGMVFRPVSRVTNVPDT